MQAEAVLEYHDCVQKTLIVYSNLRSEMDPKLL